MVLKINSYSGFQFLIITLTKLKNIHKYNTFLTMWF